ncbi:helix-turn-helix transcriptional regulator [Oscillatoria laete-virens NRMC-F 0139]|nr:helix-turn-helix transcriptional regulator [Oscillatoria laete-virens]MDL5055204.1 helix-turn-helix transcriptional regulator [Oscillatoria laete-virens NRMC-F 0139]
MKTPEKIVKLLPKIPEIHDPYHGVCWNQPIVPDNVLLFVRTDKKSLYPEDIKHYHHRFVLIMNLGTGGLVGINQNIFRLEPGQAVLIFPFQFHYFPNLDRPQIKWLFLTFECGDPLPLNSLTDRVVDIPKHGHKFIHRILESALVRGFSFGKPNHGLLRDCADLLECLAKNAAHFPMKKQLLPDTLNLLRRLNAILYDTRSGDGMGDIAALGRRLGISESHLRAEFRRLTGVSLGRYLRQTKLSRACALLSGTSRSVGSIAEECGFDSLYSFSRTFKKNQACSPLAYRKKMAGQ